MVEEGVRRQFHYSQDNGERANRNTINVWLYQLGASLKKMVLPGALAILSPLIVAFIWSLEALGGLRSTVMNANGYFSNNAGGRTMRKVLKRLSRYYGMFCKVKIRWALNDR